MSIEETYEISGTWESMTAFNIPVAKGSPIRKGDHVCFDGKRQSAYRGSATDRWTPAYIGRAITDPENGQIKVFPECLWRPGDGEE